MDTNQMIAVISIVSTVVAGIIGYNYVTNQPAVECAKAGNEFVINTNGSSTCTKPK